MNFWQAKVERNRARDAEERRKLTSMGWHCITVWECQLKPKVRQQTLESLVHTLYHIFLQNHARPYPTEEQQLQKVAEDEQRYGAKASDN